MYAIQAVYDGKTFQPREAIPVARPYDVVITFLRPQETQDENKTDIQERLAVMESLFGILPSTVTDEEIREERLKRYACPR